MKIIVISSGSEGNSTIVKSNNGILLIDVGIPYIRIKDEFLKNDLDTKNISGILITHIHNDHIRGLSSIIKKTKIKVYIPEKMYKEMNQIIDSEYIEIIDENFIINDFYINLIYTSHDVSCSVGYIINTGNKSLVYITDTGYLNTKYYSVISNKDVYIIESNHDEEMVTTGKYPYYLKKRILSDTGHLSNKDTAKHLKNIIGENTKYIVLAHVSKNNNTYDLAFETTFNKLGSMLESKKLLVAKQEETLEIIEV